MTSSEPKKVSLDILSKRTLQSVPKMSQIRVKNKKHMIVSYEGVLEMAHKVCEGDMIM